MNKISAVILTNNEERNIARCITSVLKVCNEVIVIDSGSEDKTEEICKQFNQVKFFKREWEGYAKAKNWGNVQATHSYILSVDADEEISEELAESIVNISVNSHAAYQFNRLTYYCGHWVRHCGWYPDKKIRLFDKSTAKWEGDFVHEELKLDPSVEIKWIAGNLNHYSYYTISEHKKRIEYYSDLQGLKLKAEGKKVTYLNLILNPVFKFLKTYIIQLGFLDGKAGFYISLFSAKAVYLKYRKLLNLSK
ncbi:MAG: glycosyltransferase family 2 protein [Saprospiraceae bacterium]|nr:glycosyltransferase family 2 protein [Saprospiraceae bacterium]